MNNFKIALTLVLLTVRKDIKLATLGGRLFHATATHLLKSFYARRAGTDLRDNFISTWPTC